MITFLVVAEEENWDDTVRLPTNLTTKKLKATGKAGSTFKATTVKWDQWW